MELKMALVLQQKPLALHYLYNGNDLLDVLVEAVNFARSGGPAAQILVKNWRTNEGLLDRVQKILNGLAVSEEELKAEGSLVAEEDGNRICDYGLGKITITCTK